MLVPRASIPILPDLFKLPTLTPQIYLFVSNSIWNWILCGQMLCAPFLRPLGVTRILTWNSEYNCRNLQTRNKKKKEHCTWKMVGTLMISFTPSIINFPVGKWRNHRENMRRPPPSILPPFQKIYLKYEINLSQHCIHLQSQVRHSWVRQQTKLKTNKMEQSVPINTGFEKLHFFQNYQNQGQSTEGKEKRKKRNNDKKKNQIRIWRLYQLYQI